MSSCCFHLYPFSNYVYCIKIGYHIKIEHTTITLFYKATGFHRASLSGSIKAAAKLLDIKESTLYVRAERGEIPSCMFNVARREWKWTKENPVADLSFAVGDSNARERWLTLEEEKRLLESLSHKSVFVTLNVFQGLVMY